MKIGKVSLRLRHGLQQSWPLLPYRLVIVCLIGIVITALCTATTVQAQEDDAPVAQEQEVNGYEYTVQVGDNWSSVAARTDLTVAELKAANPRAAARATGWIITGERLFIPVATQMMTVTHSVDYGDSWSTVAKEYGISMQLLKAANPRSVRYDDVLYRGETLFVPVIDDAERAAASADNPPAGEESPGEESPGEESPDDAAISAEETASQEDGDSPAATGQAVEEDTEDGSQEEGAQEDDAQEDSSDTPVPDATADEATNTGESTTEEGANAEDGAEEVLEAEPLSCPADGAGYPSQLVTLLDNGSDAEALSAFLSECGRLGIGTVANQDLTDDGVDDYVVVYHLVASTDDGQSDKGDTENGNTENSNSAIAPMDLVILNSGPDGYTIGHQARAESSVQLLSTVDINDDAQSDVAWTETTCGATDCFQTLFVYSWDGTMWRNWSAQKATMANAEIRLEDLADEGAGWEFLLDGGLYESENAGPQRARQEVWGSIDGAPYTLLTTTVAESNCLYHTVLDANAAFLNGADDQFTEAERLYTQAISDNTLEACGTHSAEIDELRSFGIFRLALISAYQGLPIIAADLLDNLSLAFPDSLYDRVGQRWRTTYEEDYDIDAACRTVEQYAAEEPQIVEVLADYGFANPTFTAQDLCPRLDIEIPPLELPMPDPPTPTPVEEASTNAETEDSADVEAAESVVATTDENAADVDNGEAAEIPPEEDLPSEDGTVGDGTVGDGTGEDNTVGDSPTEDNTVGDSPAEDGAAEDIVVALDEDGLPLCPENLAGYTAALPILLTTAAGDPLIVETWLRTCDAMDDDRGSFQLVDLNGDRVGDAIFLPTIVSDLGFGRDGAQGAVLIYHGNADGSYTLVANPEIYGEPRLLTIDDLNNDRVPDIAWSIEGCSSFCVSEVQVVTWAADTYTSTIAPGATITEGEAHFEAVPDDSLGTGQQLVLVGGVSGTQEGGLAVPHTEIWQSINRTPFQRISWSYDRSVEGSNCLGLRLVEADAALQAASRLGYEPAIELYKSSVDSALEACSIYNMDAADELLLLQGLAGFRLVQAEALGGDMESAGATLQRLQQEQAESDFTAVAEAWLAHYERDGDAAAACQELLETFAEKEDLWQITDNYGYNHPALGPEQVCFVPAVNQS